MSPRESGKFIASHAKDVTIDDTAVTKLAQRMVQDLAKGKLDYESFKCNSIYPLDAGLSLEELLDWAFVVDAINFNFWTPDGLPKFTVKHGDQKRRGYLGMVAAVNKAIAEGKRFHEPSFYGALTKEELGHIFRSETATQIPLLDDRVAVLKQISEILKTSFGGHFATVVNSCGNDAAKLVQLVVQNFPCYRDEATFAGQKVALYKRAQIVVADIDVLLCLKRGTGLDNMDSLTMFADYRVPQVLAYFGVFKYSAALQEKLDREELLPNGSPEEVEIRGCSIEAVERILAECRRLAPANANINSAKIDFFLWDYRVANAAELSKVAYHRTRCIYY